MAKKKASDHLEIKLTPLYMAIQPTSDREAAIMAGAWIDMALGDLLREHFKQLPNCKSELIETLVSEERPDARLGSFSARTLAARVLNLISNETYDAANSLRDLRNTFSHKPFKTDLTQAAVDVVLGKLDAQSRDVVGQAVARIMVGDVPIPRVVLVQVTWKLFRKIAEKIEEYLNIENETGSRRYYYP